MTAALASVGPIGWCAIAAGSWLILGITIAPRLGRLFRANDPGEHEPDHPLLPAPMDDDGWDEWLTVWPTADDAEQAVYDALFADITHTTEVRWGWVK